MSCIFWQQCYPMADSHSNSGSNSQIYPIHSLFLFLCIVFTSLTYQNKNPSIQQVGAKQLKKDENVRCCLFLAYILRVITSSTTDTTPSTPVNLETAYIKTFSWPISWLDTKMLQRTTKWRSERTNIFASQQLPRWKAPKSNFMFTQERVMCELTCGDANESQVPQDGHRHHAAGPLPPHPPEQQQATRTSFCVCFLFVLAEKSCGTSRYFCFFPPVVIHYGQIYLWRGATLSDSISWSVPQCTNLDTQQFLPVKWGAFYQMEHTLSDFTGRPLRSSRPPSNQDELW